MMFPQATSHGNILTFTPPGFKQSLNIKFPDSRLAVCEKCKKNFKTRDMCRVRNTHTSPPWATAYICITVDDSCTDENGRFIDKPLTVRMVQWQPYCVKKPFDPKTPVCASCKRTNRTRSFCRERHKHRQLPWCTVYVLLSAMDQTDPSTVVAGASKKVGGEGENGEETTADTAKSEDKVEASPKEASEESAEESKPKASDETTATASAAGGSDNGSTEDCDNINEIAESRTFLAKVSCRSNTIHWLDLADYDQNEAAFTGMGPPTASEAQPYGHPAGGLPAGIDPNHPHAQAYYHQTMGAYTAQQHHNALKQHTSYFFNNYTRGQWQHPYNQQLVGQGETNQAATPATAGEAAAQPPGSSGGDATAQQLQQQQQWALYYQQAQYHQQQATPDGSAAVPGIVGLPNSLTAPGAEQYQTNANSGENDDHARKKQRQV